MLLYVLLILYMLWRVSQMKCVSISQRPTPITITYSKLGFFGNLGNQMFQIAATVALAKRHHPASVIFPVYLKQLPISQLFNLEQFPLQDVATDINIYEFQEFDDIVLSRDGKVYNLLGYRQAYPYFDEYADEIRNLFSPRKELLDVVKTHLPPKYIAVHIRRGEYLKSWFQFTICECAYFRAAIMRLRRQHGMLPIIICTDQREAVESWLSEFGPNVSLSRSIPNMSTQITDFCTLYLAHALVISNSTFSWWAAYLRPKRTIIIPSPWYKPNLWKYVLCSAHLLYYPDWIILDATMGKRLRTRSIDAPKTMCLQVLHALWTRFYYETPKSISGPK